MANIKSAQKRILVTKRKQIENRTIKSSMNTAVKKYYAAVNKNDVAKAEELLPITVSIVDSAASKGVIHKNTAANKNGQMSRVLALLKEGKLNIAEVPVKKEAAPKKVKAVAVEPVVEEKPKKAKAKAAEAPEAPAAPAAAEEPKKVKKAAPKAEKAEAAAEPKKTKKKAE